MNLTAEAVAHPNIALAKYWGKVEGADYMPAVPSASLTLSGLSTTTRVTFDEELAADSLMLGGRPAHGVPLARIVRALDILRAEAKVDLRARVESVNDFPTASGLASSASAFAALVTAGTFALGIDATVEKRSDLARRMSVSAARSIAGGWSALEAGSGAHESLSARSLAPVDHWDVRMIVAVVTEAPKSVGSTEGMASTQRTSPDYARWLREAPHWFHEVCDGVRARDLARAGAAMEASTLAMHQTMRSSVPPLIYATGVTQALIDTVYATRDAGRSAYFTMDAGPHVKVLVGVDDAEFVRSQLQRVPGVLRTICCGPGPGARVVEARS